MPHGALALANSLATFLEMSVLLVFMRRRLSGLGGKKVLNGLVTALIAGGVMALALLGWMRLTVRLNAGSSALPWVTALGGIAVGVVVYAVVLVAMRVPETKLVMDGLKRRLRKQP